MILLLGNNFVSSEVSKTKIMASSHFQKVIIKQSFICLFEMHDPNKKT